MFVCNNYIEMMEQRCVIVHAAKCTIFIINIIIKYLMTNLYQLEKRMVCSVLVESFLFFHV